MAASERILACLAYATTAWAVDLSATRRSYADSYAAEVSGDITTAVAVLAPVLRQSPDDYLVHLRLAWLAWLSRRYGESIDHYRAASRAKPTSLEPHLGILKPLLALECWSQAETEARKVLAVEPGNPVAGMALVEALHASGYRYLPVDLVERLVERYPADQAIAALAARVCAARQANEMVQDRPRPSILPGADAPGLSVLGYGGFFGYQDETDRAQAWLAGIYASVDRNAAWKVEAAVEDFRLSFIDGREIFHENDLTLHGGLRTGAWWMHSGGHVVIDRDHGWEAGRTVLAGVWWQASPSLRTGGDLSWSHFAIAQPAVTALQATFGVGWNDRIAPTWTLGTDLDAKLIHLSDDVGHGRTSFGSGGARLWTTWSNWSASAGAWAGERCYAVTDDGFGVYDLPALYHRGGDLRVGSTITRHLNASIQVGREDFTETWGGGTAHVNRIIASFGCTF